MSETIRYQTADGAAWEAVILPEHGANCVRLTRTAAGVVQPILEDVSLERILQAPTSCGMPILFPYAGRIAGGQFTWRGTTYRAEPNRHGLVRQRPWEVVHRIGNLLACQTTVRSTLDGGFPYHFCTTVNYRLNDAGLSVAVMVTNQGAAFPYTFGVHPYLHASSASVVIVPARQRWMLDGDRIPTGQLTNVHGHDDLRHGQPLVGQTFDEVFADLVPDTAVKPMVTCTITTGSVATHVRFSGLEYPHVCVYAPPGRLAVCVEPYTGAPDAFHHLDDPRFGARVLDEDGAVAFGPIAIGCH